MTADRAKVAVLTISLATSVTARAVCICLVAMRPAKSLSKNDTAWPIVQRCSRDSTSGRTLGPMMTLELALDRPMMTGRTSTKNSTKSAINGRWSASDRPSGVPAARSTTAPRSVADATSAAPDRAEVTPATASPGQAPVRHQRKNAISVVGGGPSAGRKASIMRAK